MIFLKGINFSVLFICAEGTAHVKRSLYIVIWRAHEPSVLQSMAFGLEIYKDSGKIFMEDLKYCFAGEKIIEE